MSRPKRAVRTISTFTLVFLGLAVAASVHAGALTKLTTNAVEDLNTDAAVDVTGNAHVVFERGGSIYYRGRTGSTWSDEELVAAGTNPAVGAGASGVPQVAFLSGGGILFTARVGGTWMAPVPIGVGTAVDLAVDAGDVGHVAYLANTDTSGDSAGYVDLNYTNNAGGAFPPGPIKIWSSWYYYDGWGRAASYFQDFAPRIAVDAAGHYAIAYSHRWINGGSGWNDWGTELHVYRSATDTDVANAGLYKGYYPAPGRNSLALDEEGIAHLAFGSTLAEVDAAWSESPLPTGTGHTLAASSPAPEVALHVAYVNPTGGIEYVVDPGTGFSLPLVVDATTTGRTPVVLPLANPLVAYEAVDTGDYEVWAARTTNATPVLDAVGDRSVDEGATLSVTLSGSDGDGDALTYGASGLPTGATFDPATRTFSWTPGYDRAGGYTGVTFTVSDGTASDSEAITITVNQVNAPPVLAAIGSQTADEAAALEFTVSATDIDGNGLTFSASNLPAGAAFDPATATFSWTPGYDQAGTHTGIVFSVTDDGTPSLGDSETIAITVNNVNRPPVLAAIGEQTVEEQASLSFSVSGADADGDALTYSTSGLPAGAAFDPATRTFSWTPGYDQSGTHGGIVFTVTDGTDSDSETISVKVNDVNAPPVLTAIGDRSVSEADPLSFTVSAADVDGNSLTYSASGLPAGATFDPATRTFSWTPGYDQSGAHAGVVFSVTDDGSPSQGDSETITITVINVNRPPVLAAIGDQSVTEGDALSFTVSATDEDGDTLAFAASSLPTGATFEPATRTFSWTPAYDQAGSFPGLVFTVDDGTASDSESITITVDDNPTPPGFFTVIPCRVLDTRTPDGPLGGPALLANAARTFAVAGQCGIPASARAVSVNLTVTGASVNGNLRLYPSGIPMPLVSTINYTAGITRANNAIVPLSALGELVAYCTQATGGVHFVLDVNGYFQ